MRRSRLTFTLLTIVVLYTAASAALAGRRPIDGDEGYYAMASRLVREGKSPYADFFYPQGPLMPIVYAPFVALVGPRLLALRGLSITLGAVTVLLWALWLRRRYADRPWVAIVALLALAASPGFLDWNLTVKTYALANLGATVGLICLDGALRARRPLRWLAAGGTALGLAASARLLYAPLAVVPAVGLLLGSGRGSGVARARASLAWAGGLAIGTAPLAIFMIRDLDRFWFNNLLYHRMRFNPTSDDGLGGRVVAAVGVLGHTLSHDPSLLAMLLLASGGAWAWYRQGAGRGEHRLEPLVAAGLAVHTLASLLPAPVQDQYFTATLAPLALPLVAAGLTRFPARASRWAMPTLGAVLLALAGTTLAQPRSGVPADPVWRWEHYRRVCAKIEELTRPDDVIFAFWPGYAFETGRRVPPGMENQFGVGVSNALSPSERRRYRILGETELVQALVVDPPAMVIIGTWMYDVNLALSNAEATHLIDVMSSQYEAVQVDGSVKLCLPRPR